jgi:hypothetical protein
MIHAFLLIVVLGDSTISNNMYFRNVNDCNYFASQIVKRYGNFGTIDFVPKKHRALAYCKPVYLNESIDGIKLYD